MASSSEGQPRVLGAALLLDALLGEPPNAVHPVAWLGRALSALERRAPQAACARFWYGGVAGLALPSICAAGGWLLERWAPWPLQAVALKPAFAGRALLAAGAEVERALWAADVERARSALGALVSRPTEGLDASLASAAAIESLAENLTDSWVAPLGMYLAFGLAGAYAYRAANTADAMWGYRDTRYEWLGKVAACLDDALNWLPARLAAATLVLASGRPGAALSAWRTCAGRTASPNAGQTMAAAAGALGVRLEKPGHYVLNARGRPPSAGDLARARALVRRAMLLAGVAALALSGARRA